MTIGFDGLPPSYIGKGSPLTPNLGLSVFGMDAVLAENMFLIDTFAGNGAVSVNGSSVSSPNFNNTTPAAPANKTNVTWQVSGSSISAYVPAASAAAPNTSIQFNNGGVFGGNANLTWDNTNFIVNLSGELSVFTPTGGIGINIDSGDVTTTAINVVTGDVFFGQKLTVNNPITARSGLLIQGGATTASLVGTIGSPAGAVSANPGSLALGDNGTLYAKVTGTGTAGWQAIVTSASGSILWNNLANATGSLTLANDGFSTTFNQTSAVNWTWANTTAATGTSGFTSDGSSLTGWTNSGVTVDNTTGNPAPSFKITANSNAFISANVANGSTIQFDIFSASWASVIFAMNFGCTVGGVGPRFRFDGRGSFNSGFSIGAAMPSDGNPTTATRIIPSSLLVNSTWIRVTIVIAANGLSASWYFNGTFMGNGTLAGGIQGTYLSLFNNNSQTLWIDNIGVYSGQTQSNSPIWNLNGTYFGQTGASIADGWTIQNIPGTNASSPSQLSVVHASGSPEQAYVSVPNIATSGYVDFGSTGIITFGASARTPDIAISRFTNVVGRLALGLGLPGDYTGAIALKSVLIPQTDNSTDWIVFLTNNGLTVSNNGLIRWGSGAATAGVDIGFSRIGVGSLALGNGAANDTTGNLSLNQIIKYNGVATVDAGVAAEYGHADLTAQTANVAATTIYTTPNNNSPTGAGLYRVTVYMVVSQAGTTSTMPDSRIIYTDRDSAARITVQATNGSNGNTTSTFSQQVFVINAAKNTTIQYDIGQVNAYASTGGTPMQFAYHVKVEYLG